MSCSGQGIMVTTGLNPAVQKLLKVVIWIHFNGFAQMVVHGILEPRVGSIWVSCNGFELMGVHGMKIHVQRLYAAVIWMSFSGYELTVAHGMELLA